MKSEVIKPPSEKQYRAAKIALAFASIQIDPCRQCGWPHVEGYRCETCGSARP